MAAVVALSLAAGKLIAGTLGRSSAVTASAVDSFMDVFASSASTFAVRLARERPDAGHPFGHAKIEALAAAAQGLLVGGSGAYLLIQGAERLASPVELRLAGVTVGSMAAATVITTLLVIYLGRAAKKSGSKVIAADSVHYRTDVGANVAVLAGVGVTYATGITRIDGALTVAVALYVMASALHLLRAGVGDLLDASAPEKTRETIESTLASLQREGALIGYHGLRTRVAGHQIFVEVHIELDGALPLREAHARSNRARDAVQRAVFDEGAAHAEVLVHLDVERDE